MQLNKSIRLVLALLAILGLAAAFLFQNFDLLCVCVSSNGFYEFKSINHNEVNFIINKLLRYIINNLSAALLIFILFQDSKFSKSVTLIQTLVLIIFFPLYFYFAFSNVLLLTQLYQKLNIILLNPIIPFILGISYYFKRRKL
jgi:hypothetical protein